MCFRGGQEMRRGVCSDERLRVFYEDGFGRDLCCWIGGQPSVVILLSSSLHKTC